MNTRRLIMTLNTKQYWLGWVCQVTLGCVRLGFVWLEVRLCQVRLSYVWFGQIRKEEESKNAFLEMGGRRRKDPEMIGD